MDLRLPNITATNEAEQILQVKSYLYQLVQDLNYALRNVVKAEEGNTDVAVVDNKTLQPLEPAEASNVFTSIKSLIIKSADIIEAYGDTFQTQFNSLYVARSDFGDYVEETQQTLEAQSSGITQNYENIQTLTSLVEGIDSEVSRTKGWIKTGILDDSGTYPIVGVEVGQTSTVGDEEVFNKFSRFTANGIYFYLPGANDPIAYMEGTKLYITRAEITGSLKLGGYDIQTSNGLSFKWVGT